MRSAALCLALLVACGDAGGTSAPPVSPVSPMDSGRTDVQVSPADGPLVAVLGDSLSAGYGIALDAAWPAQAAERLAAEGLPIRILNAGVSGDTTAGGLARVDWILGREPAVLVVALGANDGLRGQDTAGIEANLRAILERAHAAGARPLLCGMKLPPNYGSDYADAFAALYAALATELDVPLVPFLLEGVGGEPDLNQPDGIHPNAAGHRAVAEVVLPHLRPLVELAVE